MGNAHQNDKKIFNNSRSAIHLKENIRSSRVTGQNGKDKMVWTKWYTYQMSLDKMVRTKLYEQNGSKFWNRLQIK